MDSNKKGTIYFMIAQALQYLELGFSIFPIQPQTKIPMVPWARFQKEHVTPERVEKFWSQNPTANIGIVCGAISNLDVLDIDPRNGGDKSVLDKSMPDSPVVLTPSNGVHHYCSHTKDAKKSTPLPGVDLQSSGSYVVAPPSLLSFGKYAFKENYDLTQRPLLPDWALVSQHQEKHDWREYLNGAQEGNRNTSAAKIVGAIIQRTNDPRIALHTLRGWNLENNPPLQDSEIEKIVSSIWNRHQLNHPITPIVITNMGDLLKNPVPDIQWQVETLWPEGRSGFICGEPEQGKTWFALDMALSISTGYRFLDKFICKQSPVLIIEEEQSRTELMQRMNLLLKGKDCPLTLEQLYVIIEEGVSFPKDTDRIIQYMRERNCKMLIIDNLRKVHSKDQNSSTEMQVVLGCFDRIKRELGAGIMIIHHMSKGGTRATSHPLLRMDGTQHLLAWADTAIGLIQNEFGGHNLEFKMRGAPKPQGLVLNREYSEENQTMKLNLGGSI